MDLSHPSSEGAQGKRKKISDEERIRRCRERNRVHARNTRERKKHQMDELRQRIETLTREKSKLKKTVVESSVADILVSLSTDTPSNNEVTGKRRKVKKSAATSAGSSVNGGEVSDAGSMLSEYGSDQPITVQQIRRRISAITNEEEKAKSPQASTTLETQLPQNADPEDIERMRRERNKLHARKTRVRKKKLMHEMERIVSNLEDEVESLRSRSRSGTLVEADAPGAGDVSSGTEMNAGASVLASSFGMKSENVPSKAASSSSSSSLSSSENGQREKKTRAAMAAAAEAAPETAVATTSRSASRGSNEIDQSSGSGEGSSTNKTHRTNSTTAGTTIEAGDSSDSKLSTNSSSSRTGHAQSLLSMASSTVSPTSGSNAAKKRKKASVADAPVEQEENEATDTLGGEFTSLNVPKRRRVSGIGALPSVGTSVADDSNGSTHQQRPGRAASKDVGDGANSSGDTSAGQGGDEGGGSGSGSGSERDTEEGGNSQRGRSRRHYGGTSKPFTVPSYSGSGLASEGGGAPGHYPSLSVESLERHNQGGQE